MTHRLLAVCATAALAVFAFASTASAQVDPSTGWTVYEHTLKSGTGSVLGYFYGAGDPSGHSGWSDDGRYWTTLPSADFSCEGVATDVGGSISPQTTWGEFEGGPLTTNSSPDDIEPDYIITIGDWLGGGGETIVGGLTVESGDHRWYRTDYDSASAPTTLVDSVTTTLYFNLNDGTKIDAPWHRLNPAK